MQPAFSAIASGVRGGAAALGDVANEVPFDYQQAVPARRRRLRGLTTFNIVLMLIVFAVLVTVYISNVVVVDGLMVRQIELERQEQMLLQERETLRAEINMLSSYNRIQKIATEHLGLVHANQQPYSLTVYGWNPARQD
ncbi:MAG: cell division protein FtsL [Bacteroidota bacterium]|nr:cell division protein FtsL [Bacteroidota bacterium]